MSISKYLIVIIGILFGFLAKAEDDVFVMPHYDRCVAAAEMTSGNTHQYIEDNSVFKCKIPDAKARKIRPRFRGVSFFEIQQLNDSQQSSISFHDLTARLSLRTNARVLPFYYVFLFRLTPF